MAGIVGEAPRSCQATRHWGKLRARSTQPSPRAAPSARTATRERAGSPRRTWQFEPRGAATRRGLTGTYVEGCRPARNVAVRAERLGREARAEWIWRSKLAQCRLRRRLT